MVKNGVSNIPRVFVEVLSLKGGNQVDVALENNQLVIKPREITLEWLCEGMTKQEESFANPVGQEKHWEKG